MAEVEQNWKMSENLFFQNFGPKVKKIGK